MDGLGTLVAIALLVALVVVAVVLWPRLRGQRPADAAATNVPGRPLATPVNPDDPDQVDEATHMLSALGGQIRPGDAVTVQIADPEPWGIDSFELDVSVAAVSRAEIRDRTGLFSFMVYWMPADQEAAVLAVEGDAPALAEVFVGRYRTERALADTLVWCRDQYLADTVHSELDFDLGEYGLGTWTAYAAREGGLLRVESGTAPLLPAAAAAGGGLPYRDCSFRTSGSDPAARLRLIQIGTFAYAFQGEVVPLRSISALRRNSGPSRS